MANDVEALVESKILDHCWACGTRFITSKPPGPAMEERHHVIPRAYGGVDGPQVSLCDKHHTMLHKIANYLDSNREAIGPMLIMETRQSRDRVMWLASMVYKAKKTFELDPNKRIPASISMDKQEQQMMTFLQKKLGKSKGDILSLALKTLFIKEYNNDSRSDAG